MGSHIILPAASDMHLHVRQGPMMQKVCPPSAARCHRVLVMPNTTPPLRTGAEALSYREECKRHMPDVDVLTTIKLLPSTTPEIVREAAHMGVAAVKLYPQGVTTHSEDGISADLLRDPDQRLQDCIQAIKDSRMVLCLHGEMPGVESKDSEQVFMDVFLEYLAGNFPYLMVVLEHVSTARQVERVRSLIRRSRLAVAATITAHHLELTHDMVAGEKIRPHLFCRPMAKWEADREALREAAMSGEPCFFLGSDSAPHEVRNKECPEGCAGVYSAPVLVESLIQTFDAYGALGRLPGFMSHLGNSFYRPYENEEIPTRRYEKVENQVPMTNPQSYRAGETLSWRLCDG